MNRLEVIAEKLENQVEDLEYLREGCEIVGLGMAEQLSEISSEIRQHIAALRAEAKPKRVRLPKLIVNNAKGRTHESI